MRTELDEDTLLSRAADAGCRVTPEQLKRWRRVGLVHRPRQEHPSGLHGSASWYPADALPQLVEVARARARTHRLGDLLIEMWWQRRWVDRRALRRELVRRLDRLTAGPRQALERHADPLDAADELVSAATLRNLSPILSLMVQRLPGGKRDLREVMWLWAVFAGGGDHDPPADHDDTAPVLEELLATAAGIDRARTDRPLGGEPWMHDGPSALEMMRELRDAGGFDIRHFSQPVRDASDIELDEARDDARLFAEDLPVIGAGLRCILGEDEAGIASIAVVAAKGANDRAAMVRTMLVLRRHLGDERFSGLRTVVEDNLERYAAMLGSLESLSESEIRRLRDELPRHLAQHSEIASAQMYHSPY